MFISLKTWFIESSSLSLISLHKSHLHQPLFETFNMSSQQVKQYFWFHLQELLFRKCSVRLTNEFISDKLSLWHWWWSIDWPLPLTFCPYCSFVVETKRTQMDALKNNRLRFKIFTLAATLSDGRINQNNSNNKMHEHRAGSSWKEERMKRNVVITGWSNGGQRREWKPKIGAAV